MEAYEKMRNSNYKLSFILKMGLLILVITIVTSILSYGSAASSGNTNSKKNQISYFDPFDLVTIYLNMPENDQINASINSQNTANTDVLVSAPPVFIPIRYRSITVKSVVRVPKYTSYYPGNPPWNPTK